MMRLNDPLKRALVEAIMNAFDPQAFQMLTSYNSAALGITYNNATAGVAGTYEELVVAYIGQLEKKFTLPALITAVRGIPAEQLNWFNDFFDLFNNVFTPLQNGKFQFNQMIFDRYILNDHLPFLSRTNIRTGFQRVCNQPNVGKFIHIYGASGSGVSYLRWYLGDVASETMCFTLVYLSLREDIVMQSDKSAVVDAATIAGFLLDWFNITDYIINKPFKFSPFFNRLAKAINDNNQFSTIYIDQFNVPIGSDIKDFLSTMGEFFLLHKIKCHVILGNCPLTNQWNFNLRAQMVDIDLGNGDFTNQDISNFFGGVYDYLSSKYDVGQLSKADFLTENQDKINEIIAIGNVIPNVTSVGEAATSWFLRIKDRIEGQHHG